MKAFKPVEVIGATAAIALTLVGAAHTITNRSPFPQDRQLHLIVRGRVVDSNGHPVRGATVRAALGLDLDGPPVETEADGRFTAVADANDWFKGDPTVRADADGYDDQWLYFPRWNHGEESFERTIVVRAHPHQTVRAGP